MDAAAPLNLISLVFFRDNCHFILRIFNFLIVNRIPILRDGRGFKNDRSTIKFLSLGSWFFSRLRRVKARAAWVVAFVVRWLFYLKVGVVVGIFLDFWLFGRTSFHWLWLLFLRQLHGQLHTWCCLGFWGIQSHAGTQKQVWESLAAYTLLLSILKDAIKHINPILHEAGAINF